MSPHCFQFIMIIVRGIKDRYTGMQVYRYAGIQVYRYTGIQVYRYTGIQVYRYTGIQVYRYTGIQVYRYTAMGKKGGADINGILRNSSLRNSAETDVEIVLTITSAGNGHKCMANMG